MRPSRIRDALAALAVAAFVAVDAGAVGATDLLLLRIGDGSAQWSASTCVGVG